MALRASLLRPSALAARRVALPVRSTRSFATKPSNNPTSQFYKTFTRPVAKVLLLAVFTYQLVYWSWVKLETDEIRAEADADLTSKVEEYKNKSKSTEDNAKEKK